MVYHAEIVAHTWETPVTVLVTSSGLFLPWWIILH